MTLEEAAFYSIYEDGCYDYGSWIDNLETNYRGIIADELLCYPDEIDSYLKEMWDYEIFVDLRTGISLLYKEWAEFFYNPFSNMIYAELIKTKYDNEDLRQKLIGLKKDLKKTSLNVNSLRRDLKDILNNY